MTSIELTEAHKSKLLEMCKTLFPEYKDILLGDEQGRCMSYQYPTSDKFLIFTGQMGGFCLITHWFEFCITHLFRKIIVEPYGYNSVAEAIADGYYFMPDENPIDYLYEEF